MIVLGALCGALLLRFRARRKQFPVEDAYFAYLYGILGMAIGAKLLFLIQSLPHIIANWDTLVINFAFIKELFTGGFVFYGGLFGGIAGVLLYARQYRFKFLYLLELLIPAIPVAHAFGRIGCFLAGCCFGIPYDGPLSICYTSTPFGPVDTPLFPVQLLESLLLFSLTAFLLLYDARAKRPRNLIGWYMFLYGIIRMITEMFRGDELRGSFLFFSTSQWISVFLIVVGFVLLTKLKSNTVPGAQFRTVPDAKSDTDPGKSSPQDACDRTDSKTDGSSLAETGGNASAETNSSLAETDGSLIEAGCSAPAETDGSLIEADCGAPAETDGSPIEADCGASAETGSNASAETGSNASAETGSIPSLIPVDDAENCSKHSQDDDSSSV